MFEGADLRAAALAGGCWLGPRVRFSLGIATTNLDSVFNSRHITLPKKVHPVKAMVLPGVIYRCKSWTIKKAEC